MLRISPCRSSHTGRLGSLRGPCFLQLVVLFAAMGMFFTPPAMACEGAERIRMRAPVELSAADKQLVQEIGRLDFHAVNAPPMALHDQRGNTYTGVGPDVLCFIARHSGLQYSIVPARDETVFEKIRQVQEGEAAAFLPLSFSMERAQKGVFTQPFYEGYYAIIARKGSRLPIHELNDLKNFNVGLIRGVFFEQMLSSFMPGDKLHLYDLKVSDGMFEALRAGEIDVVVFNKDIFTEKRFRNQYFDLEVIHTLNNYPRTYRFYFSNTDQHRRLAGLFDRYLAAIDISESISVHATAERLFLESYARERSRQIILQAASGAVVVLLLLSYMVLRRYRRMAKRLADSNRHILEQQLALQRAYQTLEQQNQTDALTRLSNRRHFDHVLNRELARCRRTRSPLSVLVLDVDHFKCVNDHFGHTTGDDYLRAIAGAIEQDVNRPTDIAARYGGEEFACLLPDTDSHNAVLVAERIRMGVAALGLPNPISPMNRDVTISIGVASTSGKISDPRELLAQADAQLYAAKRSGRDQVQSVVLD